MATDAPNGSPPTNGNGKPARYGRRAKEGEVSVDPATRVPLSAPNFGRDPLPQIITFAGMQSTLSHTYKNPDEAIRHSIDNARFMRNDCSIMECLEARQRATALLNYHLEPEDPKDPQQKQLATDLTSILEEIERFTEYRRNLLEAVWAGRTAIQNRWEWRTVRGKKRLCIRKWMPVNGDKLAFRYDDGSGKYDPNQIGIKVGGVFMQQDVLAGDRVIESTEFGRAYFLEPWERSLLTVHKHMIEDGAYEDPISAGRVHGVGVRDRIYWCWYQKQETMAQLMEVIQRTGTGFTIYYYQYGNNENKREMLDIAQKQAPTNTILMPRMSEDPSMNANGIERIEPSTAGIDAMKSIIHEFFGHQIKRYILGQILSSESAATGLGSGVADLHQDTFAAIVQYDAVNLEETITNEVVEHLKNYNFAWARDIRIKFKIDTKDNDAEKKLQAFKSAWDMGCRLKASDVMDVIGASLPDEDDEVLQNPAMQQQQRLWDQAHPQEGDLGQGGGVVGQDGQEAPEGSVEDQFGPLAGELGQGGADGEPGAGGPDGGGGGNQPPGGPPQRFAKQVKSSPGQKSMFDPETHRANAAAKWKEELHPRGDGGQFAEKGSGHMPTATEAPGGIRAKTKKSSPGQNLLGLAGDAAEQIGQALPEVPPLADEPFSLSGKPVRGKSSIPGSGKTSQKDLFAGRGDSPGQTSFADDIDPASKKVASQDEPPPHKHPDKPLSPREAEILAGLHKTYKGLSGAELVDMAQTIAHKESMTAAIDVPRDQALSVAQENRRNREDGKRQNAAMLPTAEQVKEAKKQVSPPEAKPAAKPKEKPPSATGDELKDKIREHLANGPKSLGDMRYDLGHSSVDRDKPLSNAVHAAVREMRDSGELHVEQPQFGEPIVSLKKKADAKSEPAAAAAEPHDPHLERARSVLSRIPHVSATGLVKQLGEGISVDQAHEMLATLRGEKGEEKKETARHELTPEDRAALPEHLKGVTPIFPSEAAKLKEMAKPPRSEYLYGLHNRPPGPGAVPKNSTRTDKHPAFRHGQIAYDHPLSQKEIDDYELTPIRHDDDIPDVAGKVANEMGEHTGSYLEPDNREILDDFLNRGEMRKTLGHVDREKVIAELQKQHDAKSKPVEREIEAPTKFTSPTDEATAAIAGMSHHSREGAQAIARKIEEVAGKHGMYGEELWRDVMGEPEGSSTWPLYDQSDDDERRALTAEHAEGRAAGKIRHEGERSEFPIDHKAIAAEARANGENIGAAMKRHGLDPMDMKHRRAVAKHFTELPDPAKKPASEARAKAMERSKEVNAEKPATKSTAIPKELADKIAATGKTYLSGDHHAELRQEIANAIAGKKVPKSQATANAVRTMIEDHLGATGNSGRDREINTLAALRGLAGDEPTSAPHSPALQSAIAQAHQDLHEKGLAEKPKAKTSADMINELLGNSGSNQKTTDEKKLERLENQRVELNKQGANSRGSIVSKQRKRADLDEKIQQLRAKIKATKPTNDIRKAESESAELHPLAKAAGVKSWKDANKKGMSDIVSNLDATKESMRTALHDVRTRMGGDPSHILDWTIQKAIEQTRIHGNADRGMSDALNYLENRSTTPDGDPIDLNVREQFALMAKELRKHKDTILSVMRGRK